MSGHPGRRPRTLVAALILAVVSVTGSVAATAGYIGQAPVQISLSGPSGAVSCDSTVTLTAYGTAFALLSLECCRKTAVGR